MAHHSIQVLGLTRTPEGEAHVPVLLYHAIYDSPAEASAIAMEDQPYSISTTTLRAQLEAACGARSPLITFDDGHSSQHRYALPLMLERGAKVIFFVATGRVGSGDWLRWEEIREMGSQGMAFGSHGVSHRFLTEVSPSELRREMEDSKKGLEDRLGKAVTRLSFPGGRYSRRVVEAAWEAGYEELFTSDIRRNARGSRILGRYCCDERTSAEKLASYLQGDLRALRGSIVRQRALRAMRRTLGEKLTATLTDSLKRMAAAKAGRRGGQMR